MNTIRLCGLLSLFLMFCTAASAYVDTWSDQNYNVDPNWHITTGTWNASNQKFQNVDDITKYGYAFVNDSSYNTGQNFSIDVYWKQLYYHASLTPWIAYNMQHQECVGCGGARDFFPQDFYRIYGYDGVSDNWSIQRCDGDYSLCTEIQKICYNAGSNGDEFRIKIIYRQGKHNVSVWRNGTLCGNANVTDTTYLPTGGNNLGLTDYEYVQNTFFYRNVTWGTLNSNGCLENWIPQYSNGSCSGNFIYTAKTYIDLNSCGTAISLPIDNGTFSNSYYCGTGSVDCVGTEKYCYAFNSNSSGLTYFTIGQGIPVVSIYNNSLRFNGTGNTAYTYGFADQSWNMSINDIVDVQVGNVYEYNLPDDYMVGVHWQFCNTTVVNNSNIYVLHYNSSCINSYMIMIRDNISAPCINASKWSSGVYSNIYCHNSIQGRTYYSSLQRISSSQYRMVTKDLYDPSADYNVTLNINGNYWVGPLLVTSGGGNSFITDFDYYRMSSLGAPPVGPTSYWGEARLYNASFSQKTNFSTTEDIIHDIRCYHNQLDYPASDFRIIAYSQAYRNGALFGGVVTGVLSNNSMGNIQTISNLNTSNSDVWKFEGYCCEANATAGDVCVQYTQKYNITATIYGCVESWVAQYHNDSCNGTFINEVKTYTDVNLCGTVINLPIDNNTVTNIYACSLPVARYTAGDIPLIAADIFGSAGVAFKSFTGLLITGLAIGIIAAASIVVYNRVKKY
jgi:hypothetical protein